MMTNDIILKAINLKKAYRVGDIVTWGLRGVNLEVRRGEFISIMGPSVSGKTTLLNMIGILDKPTKGDIIIDGVRVSKLSSKEMARLRNGKIGFVFQQFNLISRLTVYENIELPLVARGMPRHLRRRRVIDALRMAAGDLSWLRKKPNQLSGGQQQRVAIARALVNNPAIILADEPTGALDRSSAKAVLQTFSNVNKHGQTVIVVTHDPEVANCSNRILIIRDGIIVKEEEPSWDKCIINTVK
jgi:putative ABC transport system ATP-binding protein